MARYIGVDLHRNRFTVCVLAENGRQYLSEYRLEQLPQFVRKLRPTDELAVEVTDNTRLFHNAVASHSAKVVVVNRRRLPGLSIRWKKWTNGSGGSRAACRWAATAAWRHLSRLAIRQCRP